VSKGAARPHTADEWLALVRRQEREGELFQAYDLAEQALNRFPDDLRLKHRAALCLASTRATAQARQTFDRLGLDLADEQIAALPPNLRIDIPCLKARLIKDAALAAAESAQRAGFAEAAALYERCYSHETAAGNPEAYYPGINAATMWLLAGNRAAATKLADAVLAALDARPGEPSYYELVSAAEALLIRGETARAQELLTRARREIHGTDESDYRALASTLQQLRLIVGANGLDPAVLAMLAPPRVLHFGGHRIARPGQPGRFPADQEDRVRAEIDRRLEESNIGFAYGSLASGADILFAEAALARGATLHVVLPFDRREFVRESVAPSGRGWIGRFNRCLQAALTVRYATRDHYLGDDQLFAYCGQLAMGLALLRAHHLATEAEQIVVWDGGGSPGLGGTAVDVANWTAAGHRSSRIDPGASLPGPAASIPGRDGGRRTRAMLFGDIHGFSKLTDVQLPHFVDAVLGGFAGVIERFDKDVALANTWGDGLFVVFEDAGKAADCALALQEAIAALDLRAAGLPADMGLRLGGHLGPVYRARDPILGHDNFFGAHVSRAARIEPVTPENCVYVTETLAAVLALHNVGQFSCEYVGMTQAAKHYGRMRMFLLRRAGREAAPARQ